MGGKLSLGSGCSAGDLGILLPGHSFVGPHVENGTWSDLRGQSFVTDYRMPSSMWCPCAFTIGVN